MFFVPSAAAFDGEDEEGWRSNLDGLFGANTARTNGSPVGCMGYELRFSSGLLRFLVAVGGAAAVVVSELLAAEDVALAVEAMNWRILSSCDLIFACNFLFSRLRSSTCGDAMSE